MPWEEVRSGSLPSKAEEALTPISPPSSWGLTQKPLPLQLGTTCRQAHPHTQVNQAPSSGVEGRDPARPLLPEPWPG